MTFDQAQSPRLGQRTPVESTYVQIMDVTPGNEVQDLPEAAWHGMLLFNNTRGVLMIWNAYAEPIATWQDVAGGVAGQLTYVGTEFPVAEPPATFTIGDIYHDSDAGMKQYVWDGTQWAPVSAGAMTYRATGFVLDPLPADPGDPDADPPIPPTDADPDHMRWEPLAGTFNLGDIWYQTDDFNRAFRWNGTEWIDVQDANTALALNNTGINFGLTSDLTTRVDGLDQLASSANNTADTADGRVSMSDYKPGADDLTYLQETTNTETGEVTITEVERQNGSIWYTRTRPRRNHCKNPSLETNDFGWGAYSATIVRHDHHYVPAGDWTLHVVNSMTPEWHYAQWGESPLDLVPCEPGQIFTASVYAELLVGTPTVLPLYMSIVWLDATGTYLSISDGVHVPLTLNVFDPVVAGTMAESRPHVTATAPDGAASFYARVTTEPGNEGIEWHTGAMLIEQEDDLGRYFDGDSFPGLVEAHWDDTAHGSESYLDGDKLLEIWELRDGSWVRKYLTTSTVYELDASKLTGELDGRMIADNTVETTAMATAVVQTSEALLAGDLVHIWNDDGVFRCRKASASARYDAHGFVWEDCPVNEYTRIYHVGYNDKVKNLAPGGQWLSPIAGRVTNQPPASVGQLVQRVGYAPSSSVLNFSPAAPIRIV